MTQSNVLTFRNTNNEVTHDGKCPKNIFFLEFQGMILVLLT